MTRWRRPPALAAIALVALIATAGCLGSTPDADAVADPANDGDAAPVPDRIAFEGCREQIGAYTVAYEDAEAYLPPGFEPLGPPAGDNVTLILVGFLCTEPRDMRVFFTWMPTDPPDHLANPDAFYHSVSLPCIADTATVEVLRTWGAPCRAGDVRIDVDAQTPAGASWTLTSEGPDATVRLTGTAVATDIQAGPELIPLFHALDGHLCAVTDMNIGVHQHWEPGPMRLEVEGDPSFPVPLEAAGEGLLAPHPFEVDLTRVPIEGVPASTDTPCPAAIPTAPP